MAHSASPAVRPAGSDEPSVGTLVQSAMADVSTLIRGEGENSLLSERGSVTVDARTNTLLVSDVASSLANVRRLVTTLDIPVRQVLIESFGL